MVHAALVWPDASEKSLCTIAMFRDVYLHNHTPHISSDMSPEEVWTRSKSSHSSPKNDHSWGCSAYDIEPRL